MTKLDQYGEVLTMGGLQNIPSIGSNTAYAIIRTGIIPVVRTDY